MTQDPKKPPCESEEFGGPRCSQCSKCGIRLALFEEILEATEALCVILCADLCGMTGQHDPKCQHFRDLLRRAREVGEKK